MVPQSVSVISQENQHRASRPLSEHDREKAFGNLRTYIETPEILSAISGRVAESKTRR